MHETGHALGLKHPQDVKGAFGAMPLDHDSLEYSVMSYRSYIGASTTSGYTNGTWSYPQTLMMYDIAALQTMYGANYTTNSGDTVYRWSPTTGEELVNGVGQGVPGGNKIFMTLWDGGGHDTYNFSNYTTNLLVDLQPGHWTTVSATQLANLGGTHLAAGNIANALLYNNNPASLIEDAVGGSGNDTLIGNAADNMLTGGAGNDVLDGGAGADIAVFSGLQSNYSIILNADGSWTITDLRGGSPDGIDKLSNIELAKFVDSTFTLGSSPPAITNHEPVAVDDIANVKEDTAVDINVLANDIDPDSDLLSILGTPTALHGSVTVNADGTLHYLSNANYNGSDTISYTVTDGSLTDVGQVAVTVTAVNDAPVATDDTYAIAKNKKLIVSAPSGVLANDHDADGSAITDLLVGKPSHGSLKLNSDGSFIYTPTKNFVGIDTFTYKNSDGSTTSNVATVTIYVGTSAGQMAGANGPQATDYHGWPDVMKDYLSWLNLPNGGQLHSALFELLNDQVPMPVEQQDQLMPYADALSHSDFLFK